MSREEQRESPNGYHFYSTFRTCPRKGYLRYVLGYTPEKTMPLIFGSALHEVMEKYWKGEKDGGRNLDLDLGKRYIEKNTSPTFKGEEVQDAQVRLELMLTEWYNTWAMHDAARYDVVEVEKTYEIPLGPKEEFRFTLRVDRVMYDLETEEYFVFDVKTTGWSAEGMYNSVAAEDQMLSYVAALNFIHPEWKIHAAMPDIIYSRGNRVEAKRPGPLYYDRYAIAQWFLGMYGTILEVSQKVAALRSLPSEILFPRNGSHCAKFGCDFEAICRTEQVGDPLPVGFTRDEWTKEIKDICKLGNGKVVFLGDTWRL